jgi:hypothetical protein
MAETNVPQFSADSTNSATTEHSTFGEVVLLGARRGFRFANLVASIGACIMLLVAALVLGYRIAYFEGIAILAEWGTLKAFGNILGFYIVTVAWGIVIGAAIATAVYGYRCTARRGS